MFFKYRLEAKHIFLSTTDQKKVSALRTNFVSPLVLDWAAGQAGRRHLFQYFESRNNQWVMLYPNRKILTFSILALWFCRFTVAVWTLRSRSRSSRSVTAHLFSRCPHTQRTQKIFSGPPDGRKWVPKLTSRVEKKERKKKEERKKKNVTWLHQSPHGARL